MKGIWIYMLVISLIMTRLARPLPLEASWQAEKSSQHMHFDRAEEYRRAKEYDKAIEEYQKSIKSDPDYAWAYWGLVMVSRDKREPDQAREYMETLTKENPNNACAWYGLGYFYFSQEDWDEASRCLKKSVQINPELGNAHNIIGAIHYVTGQFDEALESFELSLRLFQATDDKKGEASAITNIGAIHGELGNLKEALEYYLKALELDREIGFQRGEMIALNNVAEFYRASGDLTRALEHYTMSLELSEDLGSKTGTAACFNYIGSIHYDMGNLARALEFQKEALELHRELGIERSQAIDLGDMAVVYRGLGDLTEALRCLEESLGLERELRARSYEAKDLNSMAEIYRELGDLSASVDCCSQALHLYRELGDRVGEANSLNEMGLVHFESHNYDQALECLNESLRMAKEMHVPETIWRCEKNIGDVYAEMNQSDDALQSYRSSIEVVEGIRKKLELEKFKTSFMESKMEVYETIVSLLMQMDRKNEAFQYIERAKARALVEMLTEAKIDIHKGVGAELLAQEHEIFRNISTIQTGLQNPDLSKNDREDLTRSLHEQEERLEYLQLELRKKNPLYADLLYPEPYSVERVQRELLRDEDTVLLEYLLGETRSYVWIIFKGGLEVASLPPREEIERAVRRLLSVISQPPTHRTFSDQSRQLCTLLIPNNGIGLSRASNLIIVPDGILFYLPFEALLQSKSEGSGSKNRFLLEDFDISYAPSASTLDHLQKRRSKREQPMELLILADPCYRREETEWEPAKKSTTEDLYGGYSFPRLRFSGQEARLIAALYPEQKAKVLLREQAREEEMKIGELQGCRIVHFATHGVLDEIVPRRSGVVLALDGDPAEDGFLQIHEIFNLRLDADIVILSACQTGLGRLLRGEGMVGLSRAFFYAGASSVIASLWSVNDRSTALLMTHFHENLKNGIDKRSALKEAKLTLLAEGGRLAHPYYWAPFVLTGDYR